ncbi:MAG: C1 family peptidase [Phycisphaeraceae bacterium]|nr:C1 family peptidase [Phycisphaeraceae bacterium]
MRTRLLGIHFLLYLFLIAPGMHAGTVDHSISQSPVKNQGSRGTCVAFAICAALETFPGIPADLSEQVLYATVKLHQQNVDQWLRRSAARLTLKEGDLFDVYAPLFELLGTCHAKHLPYDPRNLKAGPDVPEEIRRFLELTHASPEAVARMRDAAGKYGFRMADCQVLDITAARDVARLKKLLDDGVLAIPMGYRVHVANWTNVDQLGNRNPDTTRPIIHPGMMQQFAPTPRIEGQEPDAWLTYNQARLRMMREGTRLVEELDKGNWLRRDLDPRDAYGGHAVTIVGYNDLGFIVKNSWGTDWGDNGYAIVSYDYHHLYVMQGLLIRKPMIRIPALNPFEKRERIQQARYLLKIQPRIAGDDASWMVSFATLDLRDPDVEVVEYQIEVEEAGQWRPLVRRAAYAGPREDRQGAAMLLDGPIHRRAIQATSVRFTVRFGDLPLGDPAALHEARYLVTRRFPPFDPRLPHILELSPLRP